MNYFNIYKMESKKDYIFVYGLFRDQSKKLLGDCVHCGKTFINGRLWKVNEFYPGFTKGGGKVWGDVYLFDSSLLGEMDEYEGDEYKRVRIKTASDIECWVYEYKFDTKDIIEIKSGDWYLR
jgi:gamma-glutamylcyclotransferase (GGCT)/AIG2-like uncharacterized protein YtfP